MAKGEFPVSFNFKAFESVSATIDKVNGKFASLKAKITESNNRFQILQSKTEGLRTALSATGDKLTSVGSKLTLGVTTPLALLAGKMLHTSIAAEETASKFEQVFKNVGEGVRNAAVDRLKSSFDLSTQSAQEMLATTGLLAKDLGLTGTQALSMGERVTDLAVQVAAFRNVEGGAERATEILRAAMLGQVKGLKQLGIVIDETDVRTEAMAMAQKGARFETVEQAKALATLSLINKRTKDDQEDFKNSSQELENQLRVTSENFKEVSNVVGNILKPVFAGILSIGNRVQKLFLKMSPGGQKFVVVLAAIAAAVGPVLVGLGILVGTILPAIITGLTAIAAIGVGTMATFAGIAAAVVALIGVGVLLVNNWDTVKDFFLALWDGPAAKFLRFITGLDLMIAGAKTLMANWEPIKEFFTDLFSGVGNEIRMLLDLFDMLFSKAKGIGSFIADIGSKLLFGDKNPFQKTAVAGDQNTGIAAAVNPQQQTVGQAASGIGVQAQQIGRAIAQEIRTVNDARVQLDFNNMPRGTQVRTQSTGIPPTLNLGTMGGSL